MNWNTRPIHALIRSAFAEDHARADVTARTLIDPAWTIEAVILSKQKGIVAGLPLAERFFKTFNSSLRFRALVQDGRTVKPNQRLALIKGRARSILTAERPALNALQHLSGIATFTAEQVKRLKGTRIRLYDTRKTLPGWRVLQKYAVRCGGANNHRMTLGDEALIKENHLKIARLVGSDWMARVARLKKNNPSLVIQMEIQTDRDLADALRCKPQRVLLDNLAPSRARRMMAVLRRHIPGIEIELTGGITPESLRQLARLKPDRISMGRLTHSVRAFDCSLDILRVHTH